MTSTAAPPIQVENYIAGVLVAGRIGSDAREPRSRDGRPGRRSHRSRASRTSSGRSSPRAPTFDDGVWPTTSGRERAAILLELARLLREEIEPLVPAGRHGDGQTDPLRARARDRTRHRPDPVLRRRRAARPWRDDVVRRAPPPRLHAQGAGRGVRPDHAVERPGRPAAAQDRRRDRDGLHVRPQAGQRCAGIVDGDLQAARADPGVAGGGRERRRRRGPGHRRGSSRRTRASTS